MAEADTPAEESSVSAAPVAPLRRWFAGGGHIPELGIFVGSGSVLAEQQPDGTWKLAEDDAAPVEDPAEPAAAAADDTALEV